MTSRGSSVVLAEGPDSAVMARGGALATMMTSSRAVVGMKFVEHAFSIGDMSLTRNVATGSATPVAWKA